MVFSAAIVSSRFTSSGVRIVSVRRVLLGLIVCTIVLSVQKQEEPDIHPCASQRVVMSGSRVHQIIALTNGYVASLQIVSSRYATVTSVGNSPMKALELPCQLRQEAPVCGLRT